MSSVVNGVDAIVYEGEWRQRRSFHARLFCVAQDSKIRNVAVYAPKIEMTKADVFNVLALILTFARIRAR
jgi:hypothetical protein